MVPTDPNAEAQPTAGQEINIGCLACDERGLALRKHQDPGREPDALGDPGQIAEHHERIVERVVLVVRARQLTRPIGVNGPEHVVVSEEVVKADVFNRSPEPSDRGGVASKLVLRVRDTNLHERQPPIDGSSRGGAATGNQPPPIHIGRRIRAVGQREFTSE